MEHFNIDEYHKFPSRKVVTRDGRKVRIICTDRKRLNYPIVALIENKPTEGESVLCYTKEGKFYTDSDLSDSDLLFAPEKHEGWVNLYKWTNKDCAYYIGSIYNSKAEAENKRGTSDKCVATIKIEWEEDL